MLILDEQLLGRNLEVALARWYRGSIVFITDLRPHSIIKDEAVPVLFSYYSHRDRQVQVVSL